MLKKRNLLILFFISIIALLLFTIFIISRNFSQDLISIFKENPFIGPVLLVLWRILGIIVPAIPAGIVSFAAVPIFGWFATYIYTLTGIMLGTSISFFLARRFKEPLVG
ncbi:MAG: hypothetical protein AAB675_01125, partial [Patescibacteria group bacterium]